MNVLLCIAAVLGVISCVLQIVVLAHPRSMIELDAYSSDGCGVFGADVSSLPLPGESIDVSDALDCFGLLGGDCSNSRKGIQRAIQACGVLSILIAAVMVGVHALEAAGVGKIPVCVSFIHIASILFLALTWILMVVQYTVDLCNLQLSDTHGSTRVDLTFGPYIEVVAMILEIIILSICVCTCCRTQNDGKGTINSSALVDYNDRIP